MDYKTVNMYSLSAKSWSDVARRIQTHLAQGGVNDYYETIFAGMIHEGSLSLEGVRLEADSWYEVDTLEDLNEADRMFLGSGFEEEILT